MKDIHKVIIMALILGVNHEGIHKNHEEGKNIMHVRTGVTKVASKIKLIIKPVSKRQ